MASASSEKQDITEPLLERSGSTGDEPAHARQPSAGQPQEAIPSSNDCYDEEAAQGLPAPSSSVDDLQLQNLPQATSRWRAQRALMVAWLLGSVVTLLLSSFSPFLGTTAGLAGITGSSWYFCHCCGVKQAKDIAANVRIVRRLAVVAGWLSGLYTVLLAVVSSDICSADEAYSEYCTALRAMFFILTVWHFMHAALSVYVARKAYKIEPLLNPFTSGMLS
ncbi:hypothetical protein WJX74_010874 [Apatococcus lobatus]|uniref:Transmembrane protein n=1 Tax=Apatococcus lobatus TaxID=904363 RepID=A0AAW1SGH6_9CHLO